MIRIPLIIEKTLWDGKPCAQRLFLVGTVHVHGAHTGFAKLTFAVDTGSPFTLFSLKDAARMKIPEDLFHLQEPILFGGAPCYRMALNRPTTLYLQGAAHEVIDFPFAKFGTPVPIANDAKTLERVAGLPSLVGMDFLTACSLKFVFDPSKDEAYLETEKGDMRKKTEGKP